MRSRVPRGRGGRIAARRRWLRRIGLASFATAWIGVVGLALPLVAHGQTDTLLSYGVTASAWSIQPYAVNDAYLNVPLDEAAPYVYVNIDGSPSAAAQAAYFYPGSAINGVLATQGVQYKVPSGVKADYQGPGSPPSSASNQVGAINDGVATQLGAGTQAAQASEAYAMAQAALASYQFAPPPGALPTGGGLPSTPTVPGLPTPPPLPLGTVVPPGGSGGATATPGGGSAATPTPTATAPTPAPTATPTKLCIPPLCLPSPSGHTAVTDYAVAAPLPGQGFPLPDLFEQRLITSLRGAELANPSLLAMASNGLPVPNPALPLAGADATSQAVAQANDAGVGVTVDTHVTHLQLFQGLITFASLDTTVKAGAPATPQQGSGTITTQFTGAAIAGIPVTIDANGVQIDCQGSTQPPCVGSGSGTTIQTLSSQLNQALKAAGIQVALGSNTTYHDIEKWQGSGGGVEVTGYIAGTNGVSPSHLDFSLAHVTATLYAVPNVTFGGGPSGSSFGGGGYPSYGGFGSSITSIFSSPGSSGSPGHSGNGVLSVLGSLSRGELLALLAVVQGFSTAAVSAAASNASAAQKATQAIVEEESQ